MYPYDPEPWYSREDDTLCERSADVSLLVDCQVVLEPAVPMEIRTSSGHSWSRRGVWRSLVVLSLESALHATGYKSLANTERSHDVANDGLARALLGVRNGSKSGRASRTQVPRVYGWG